jgi:putative transcriptional regulator
MTDSELLARDAKRDIWQETLDAIDDIQAGRFGHTEIIEQPPVLAARQKLGFSERRFADLLGVSVRTLQDWENGSRKPTKAAMSLIQIAQKRPDVLHEVFG